MDRRTFMIGAGSAAGIVLLPNMASAEANRIDWYTSSDTNVLDFWNNFVKPKFEAANPGITMNRHRDGQARSTSGQCLGAPPSRRAGCPAFS
jgi:putative spermidine/putrescine transport system substrate-binding protein